MNRTNEAAFETVIEFHLLENGYSHVAREGFDRERAIFPETVLAFIRETQPKEWAKLETLHSERINIGASVYTVNVQISTGSLSGTWSWSGIGTNASRAA